MDFSSASVRGTFFACTTGGGFGARISGDNFALILRDTGDEKLPETVIRHIQKKLAALAVGKIGAAAMGAAAERPEMLGKAIAFVGLGEGIALFGFLISLMMLNK